MTVSHSNSRRRGLTLVEVLVSILILGIVTGAWILAVLFTMKQNHQARLRQHALDAANYFENLIVGSEYATLGEATATGLEASFNSTLQFFPDPTYDATDSNGDGLPDTALTGSQKTANAQLGVGIRPDITATFRLTGWGTAGAASASTISAASGSPGTPWVSNEWAGSYVQLNEGIGAGQVALVTSNNDYTLTITSDLSGTTSTDWGVTPTAGTTFTINGGKTADMTISWTDGRSTSGGSPVTYTLDRRVLKTR